MNATLLELCRTRYFLADAPLVETVRTWVLGLAESRVSAGSVAPERRLYMDALRQADGHILAPSRMQDFQTREEMAAARGNDAGADPNQKRICMYRLTGPMTRDGGECSYGSLQLRDAIMENADRDDVVAHILYTRTGGGAADTVKDFRKAIEYAHSKGQKVYMYCDGSVASAGVFVGAICDGIYAYNADDEIGSIGMYCSFFTVANGAENKITGETYREYYCSKSPDKNRWYRDAADGNLDTVAAETEAYLDRMLAALTVDRPSITEDQKTGAMYRMGDVVGSLLDGITTLPELCQQIFREAESAPKNNQKSQRMKEYEQIALAAGYEAGQPMASDTEGQVTLQAKEADNVEKSLADLHTQLDELHQSEATLKEANDQLTEQVNQLNAAAEEHAKAVESLKDEHEQALEAAANDHATVLANLKESHDKAVADLQAEVDAQKAETDARQTALEQAQADLAQAQADAKAQAEQAAADIASRDQAIADLQSRLATLESGEGQRPDAGEGAASNGAQPEARTLAGPPTYDPSKSALENDRIMRQYLDAQRLKTK